MKKIIQYIIILILTALLAWGICWAHTKAGDELCTAVDVEILNADSTSFVTPEGIKSELHSYGFNVVGKPLWQINVNKIEQVLRKSRYLETANCAINANGHLIIRVTQMVPVMRIFDGYTSYYVNANGKRMDATPLYHADVPVIQGHFTKEFPATRLLPLVKYVSRDQLLNSLITMYSVRDSDNIYCVPGIHGHVVNIGSMENFEQKLSKLVLFYRKVLPDKGWETYDTISVKWDHQVVATRRAKKVHTVIELDSTDTEPDVELSTLNGTGTEPQQENKTQNNNNKKP